VFYDRLQADLVGGGFDAFVEGQCAAYYAARRGRPSLPPGRYFRMLLVGHFEGIDSERGLEWRCADSLSLREFLRLGEREPVPDHSRLSRTRGRLPLELHDRVFTWVLQRLAEHGLIKGERTGVDASTMEANAALRAIVRRDTGEGYREMLTRMAEASGIETPTAADLARLDRRRKGKTLSNAEWESPADPDARIAKLKDGRTHLAHKPEHAVDLDPGAVVAAEMHPADRGDTATLPGTLDSAARHLAAVEAAPAPRRPPSWWRTKATTRARCWSRSTAGRGRRASPSRSATASCAGMAMMRPAARWPTTAPACSPAWRTPPSSCAPRSSSAASRSFSTAAACGGRGCAAGRTCTSGT
jgi:transposase